MHDFTKDLVFIGQSPSRETDSLPPFAGRDGKDLAALIGKSQDQMLRDHDFVYLIEKWPGKSICGDRFPMPAAKTRVRELFPHLRGKMVALIGSKVSKAFGCEHFAYFRWYQMTDHENPTDVVVARMVVIPDPSYSVRWYGNVDNRDQARKFLQYITRRVGA